MAGGAAKIDFMNLVRAFKSVEMSVRVTIVEKMDAEAASAFKEAFYDIGPQRAIDIIHAQKEIISVFVTVQDCPAKISSGVPETACRIASYGLTFCFFAVPTYDMIFK